MAGSVWEAGSLVDPENRAMLAHVFPPRFGGSYMLLSTTNFVSLARAAPGSSNASAIPSSNGWIAEFRRGGRIANSLPREDCDRGKGRMDGCQLASRPRCALGVQPVKPRRVSRVARDGAVVDRVLIRAHARSVPHRRGHRRGGPLSSGRRSRADRGGSAPGARAALRAPSAGGGSRIALPA